MSQKAICLYEYNVYFAITRYLQVVLIIFILIYSRAINSFIKDIIREVYKEWDNKIISDRWKNIAYYSRLICAIDISIYIMAMPTYCPEPLISYMNKPVESRIFFLRSSYPEICHKSPIYELINIVHCIQILVMAFADSLSKTLFVTLVNYKAWSSESVLHTVFWYYIS